MIHVALLLDSEKEPLESNELMIRILTKNAKNVALGLFTSTTKKIHRSQDNPHIQAVFSAMHGLEEQLNLHLRSRS